MTRRRGTGVGIAVGAAWVLMLVLTGCAVEVQNRQPAQEMAQRARPPGSVYNGWRVFQDRCAGCHGTDANGIAGRGPDLLPLVREMAPQRFLGVVLRRYDVGLPLAQARTEGAAREALIEGMAQRREGALVMPEWQGEPRVNAHIVDLYAYLSARAQGTQGVGKPAP
jgi:hypothetical protein